MTDFVSDVEAVVFMFLILCFSLRPFEGENDLERCEGFSSLSLLSLSASLALFVFRMLKFPGSDIRCVLRVTSLVTGS